VTATPTHERSDRERLRRQLLAVLLSDAAAVTVLTIVGRMTRSRPSGGSYSAIAVVAAASLAPGVVAVAHEERVHRSGSTVQHRMTAPVLLFGAGMLINTLGTVLILTVAGSPERRAAAVDIALLIGGDAIGVPYLSLVRALHTRVPAAGGAREPPE
jgi:hypothetical protein